MDLSNLGGFAELKQFQEYLFDYRIVVLAGLNSDRVIFSGNSLSSKKLYLLYIDSGQYNVITNLKAAVAKRYLVTRVTLYMTKPTSVTKLAPCVMLHQPLLKIRSSFVLHATIGFSVRSVSRII